jgi:hypothetical protein
MDKIFEKQYTREKTQEVLKLKAATLQKNGLNFEMDYNWIKPCRNL